MAGFFDGVGKGVDDFLIIRGIPGVSPDSRRGRPAMEALTNEIPTWALFMSSSVNPVAYTIATITDISLAVQCDELLIWKL